jgi:hypothetical protein
LEKELENKNQNTITLTPEEFSFDTKIGRKRINIEIRDTNRENFLEISAASSRKKNMNNFYRWSNKQLFGLKYSLWIVLIIIALSLIPLIISLAVQDGISTTIQDSLKIIGIVLISFGGALFILYYIFMRLSLGKKTELFDAIDELIQEIVNIIEEYKEDSSGKKVCWNCFKEIDMESPKCPYCQTKL